MIAELIQAFPDARIVETVSLAADQDGHDGGFTARDDKGNEAWGETADDARKLLKEIQR